MTWNPFARNADHWRGYDGEEEMTEDDWAKRGLFQAMGMQNGLGPHDGGVDEDGDPTGGCYNGDYSDAIHEEANARLDEDEYYEAEQTSKAQNLFSGWFRRNNE